ncbi:hypothetical protein D1610_06300 [Sphingomonas gilva]|uniref:Uncharacterized protein n=1 Tax=Sphingomonas gilva TaxID=2305907 RepID=A0A396RNL8_9SPHN|nr:hypothetical protein D1610_06300 [Sphingomonas gilva]
MLADQGHQSPIMDVALSIGERTAFPQSLQHVVELGKRQIGMRGEYTLAQCIECFGFDADTLLKRVGYVGGEGVKAARIVVSGTIFQRTPHGKCPSQMNTAT